LKSPDSGQGFFVFPHGNRAMQSLAWGRRFALTALTSVSFGVAMFSNGVFTRCSPLHGIYAIGIFSILTPLLFQVGMGAGASARMAWVTLATSLMGMAYLWLMMSGLLRWLQHRNGSRHAT